MAEIHISYKNKHKKNKLLWGFLLSFTLIISSILLLFYPFASKDKASYFDGENPILIDGQQAGNAIIENGNVYLPLSIWQEEIDSSITYDSSSNSVIVTTSDKVVQFPSESVSYFVNDESVELQFHPLKDENGEIYLALDPLVPFYPLRYSVLDDNQAILIEKDGQETIASTITSEIKKEDYWRLRTEASFYSPYVDEVKNGESVSIEKTEGDFYFVRKENGVAGYIKKNMVDKGETVKVSVPFDEYEPQLNAVEGPIQLTWESVYTKNPDTDSITEMEGVNVVSPTWFKLSGNKGNVSNLGSTAYVEWAHEQNYQVWGLFSNDFDPDKTHAVLKDFHTRQKVIRQLLVYSEMYQLDGINIDIENVNEEDGQYVTQFVREATPYFHQAGLTVSMDITFIAEGNYSAFLERDHLSEIVDYLIVMAYDEHWGSSPIAGSVASLPWVESNLQTLMEEVPNDKLVLGVPLYARLWEEKENGEMSSEALSMEKVEEWLKEYQVTPTYDEASGQNYGEYYDESTKSTYKIWLEDATSLAKRAELVDKYDLAGLASWSRYFANEDAWTALNLVEDE